MIDSSIIAQVKKRDNKAFKVLYESCIGYVYSIVRRYITNESEHPDVIQEIFARLILSIATFDESKGPFKFWLRRLVINQCFQHYRQGKSPRLFVALEVANELDNGEEHQLHKLSKAEIETYLKQMPEGYRQIFMLVIIDEYSHKEVGEQLGISATTSRSKLSRAKSWLQQRILKKSTKIALANGL